jgi:hypothetical protein
MVKIYTKIVIDIETSRELESESFNYDGEVVECKGPKTQQPQAFYSQASNIIRNIGLKDALKKDILTNPFLDQSSDLYKQSVADIRGGYGARGLEGSGIAIKGEQDSLQKIVNQAQAQRAGQLIGILGTGSASPAVATPQQSQGSGFLGMK